jgi:type IV pilus assembly protein PilW
MNTPNRKQTGFTLVELMVSMLLGLVVVGGVISVLLANRNSYRASEGISQVQESARTAFELMARDVRQSGSTGCSRGTLKMANVLTNASTWWGNWVPIRGFDAGQTDPAVTSGTGAGQRVSTTSSVQLHGIDGGVAVTSHNPSGTIVLQGASNIVAGDILMICDFSHAALFRATSYNNTTNTITYTTGSGNCAMNIGPYATCASGASYTFQRNAWVGRVTAMSWYIGNNNRPADGGRSLYRARLAPGGVIRTEELVSGVTDMQITYGRSLQDSVTNAAAISALQWDEQVNSMFIRLTVRSTDVRITTDPGVDDGRFSRPFTYIVSMRNRIE